MAEKIVRAAIVGGASLLGKELADELSEVLPAWNLTLLAEESAGTLATAGDEPTVVQPLTPEAFAGVDVAFFAADARLTKRYCKAARERGASIVDLTGALESEPEARVCSPLLPGGPRMDLTTTMVVSAHPAAIMLAVLASRLERCSAGAHLAATVLEPASQQGSEGLEEMHQQTVGLLSFKDVPKALYGEQVAFNLTTELGKASKVDLGELAALIRRHVALIASSRAEVSLQLVQAPVFHGYTMSIFAELAEGIDADRVRQCLDGDPLQMAIEDEIPSNVTATARTILTRVQEDVTARGGSTAFWLWAAADNLKLAARNAAACARELIALRGGGALQ